MCLVTDLKQNKLIDMSYATNLNLEPITEKEVRDARQDKESWKAFWRKVDLQAYDNDHLVEIGNQLGTHAGWYEVVNRIGLAYVPTPQAIELGEKGRYSAFWIHIVKTRITGDLVMEVARAFNDSSTWKVAIETNMLNDDQIWEAIQTSPDDLVMEAAMAKIQLENHKPDELLVKAKKVKSIPFLMKIVNTFPLSFEKLMEIGHTCESPRLWQLIFKKVNSANLSAEEKRKMVSQVMEKDDEGFTTLVQTDILNNSEIIKLTQKLADDINEPEIWLTLLSERKFSGDEMMLIGSYAKNRKVWKAILSYKEVFNSSQLFNLGEEINTITAWQKIGQSDNLNFNDRFTIENKITLLRIKNSRSKRVSTY